MSDEIERAYLYWAYDDPDGPKGGLGHFNGSEAARLAWGAATERAIARMEKDGLCLRHIAGFLSEDVDCIACFEQERAIAEIEAVAQQSAADSETVPADYVRGVNAGWENACDEIIRRLRGEGDGQ